MLACLVYDGTPGLPLPDSGVPTVPMTACGIVTGSSASSADVNTSAFQRAFTLAKAWSSTHPARDVRVEWPAGLWVMSASVLDLQNYTADGGRWLGDHAGTIEVSGAGASRTTLQRRAKSTTPPPIGAQQPAASEYTGLTELSLWALRIPATAPAGLSYRPGGYLERYAVGEYVFHLWSSSLCDDAYLASASTNPTAAAQDLQECRALRRWYYQQLVAIGFPLRSRQGDAVPTLAEDDFVYATTSSSVPAPTPPSPYTDATAYRQLVLSLLTPARFHANDAPFMYVRGFIDTEVPCWNGGTHRFVPRPANLRWRALTLDGARQTPYQNLEQENSALLRAQSLTSNAVAPTAAQSMGRVGLPGALALELSDVQLINSPADGLGINNVDVDLNTVTMVNTQRGGLTVVGRSCARITNVVMTSAAAQPGDQLGTINIEPTLGGIGGFGDATANSTFAQQSPQLWLNYCNAFAGSTAVTCPARATLPGDGGVLPLTTAERDRLNNRSGQFFDIDGLDIEDTLDLGYSPGSDIQARHVTMRSGLISLVQQRALSLDPQPTLASTIDFTDSQFTVVDQGANRLLRPGAVTFTRTQFALEGADPAVTPQALLRVAYALSGEQVSANYTAASVTLVDSTATVNATATTLGNAFWLVNGLTPSPIQSALTLCRSPWPQATSGVNGLQSDVKLFGLSTSVTNGVSTGTWGNVTVVRGCPP